MNTKRKLTTKRYVERFCQTTEYSKVQVMHKASEADSRITIENEGGNDKDNLSFVRKLQQVTNL